MTFYTRNGDKKEVLIRTKGIKINNATVNLKITDGGMKT